MRQANTLDIGPITEQEVVAFDMSLASFARNGDMVSIKALLDAGADANAKDYNGRTALMMANVQEHTEVADLLRKAGATE